jgi:hypothetical protein
MVVSGALPPERESIAGDTCDWLTHCESIFRGAPTCALVKLWVTGSHEEYYLDA